MNVIQSLWTKPVIERGADRFRGGWISERYNLISWGLSALLLQRHYGMVTLVTDKNGVEFLCERLQLPYANVNLCLEDLSDCPTSMWAMGKLKCYSIQSEPFLHVDGDAFLWSPLDSGILTSEFFCQNLEINTSIYFTGFEMLSNYTLTSSLLQRPETICACNAGVIGGHNLQLFRELYDEVVRFIAENRQQIIGDPNSHILNLILEQFLIYQVASKNNVRPRVVFDHATWKRDTDVMKCAEIEQAIYSMKYNHLLGAAKRDRIKLKIMERIMQIEFPDYYYKIIKLLSE